MDVVETTLSGSSFQILAAATETARLSIVDNKMTRNIGSLNKSRLFVY